MAEKRQEFHRSRTGNLTVREDRWSVLLDTGTGAMSVEHRWTCLDPDNGRQLTEDNRVCTLAEFASTELGQELQSRLNPAIEAVLKAQPAE